MEEFKLDPLRYKEIKRNYFGKLIMILAIVYTFIMIYLYFSIHPENKRNQTLKVLFPVTFLGIGCMVYANIKRHEINYFQFRIYFDTNELSLKQAGHPPIFIPTNEIQEILQSKNGALYIRSNKGLILFAPFTLENYQRAKILLSEIKPIKNLYFSK